MLGDDDQLRAVAATLRTEACILWPVRHHSPACALQLERLLATVTPCAVLVEGPRSFTPLLPWLAHGEAAMPLAIYTYAVHGKGEGARRSAAYYPFCDYSPELVAIRDAAARAIPARFIDLDFAEQEALERSEGEQAVSLLDERRFRDSDHLRLLAERLGCRSHEELWEHLFEVAAGQRDIDEHVAAVVAYCELSRRDATPASLHADGTLAREAEMAWHIQQAIAARKPGDGPVLAVVGGFHAAAIAALLEAAVQRPAVAGPAADEQEAALIRYTFERLDRLNGYASGMTSPGWHQHLWERRGKDDGNGRMRDEAGLALLFDVAAELRTKRGIVLPTPALAAAHEQMRRLCALRGRVGPVRDDLLDAITSCFIKGDADADGALVRAAARRQLTGDRVGRVPAGAGTPPLVRDFAWRARRQRLKIDDVQPRRLVLDLYRRPEHRVTSRLLHALVLLDVPFAVRTAGPDFVGGTGLERIQESWEYTYGVASEAALVEASVHGGTVPLAAATRFTVLLQRQRDEAPGDARQAASMLARACVLGLHDHVPRATGLLREAIGADGAFEGVVSAVGTLALLLEASEPLEARHVEALPDVLAAAYERAVYLGTVLEGVDGDGRGAVAALVKLREVLGSTQGRALDASLYAAMISALRQSHPNALLRGACTGLAHVAGDIDAAAIAVAVEGYLLGALPIQQAVDFLRGVFATSREAAWQEEGVIHALDRALAAWDEAAFVGVLPALRLAFAELTPRETDRVAGQVATLHGGEAPRLRAEYQASAADVQQHLEASALLRQVFVADGLAAWVDA
ncbi:hypothetical protein KPL74_02435 [Bacillus sp. NP157]|nr:hypothetical protein KPL74_02435 [Bacillus sp. NP157]